MGKFLETYSHPRQNKKETKNLYTLRKTNKFESGVKKKKNPPTNKNPGQEVFAGGFYQIFPEEQTPILILF